MLSRRNRQLMERELGHYDRSGPTITLAKADLHKALEAARREGFAEAGADFVLEAKDQMARLG